MKLRMKRNKRKKTESIREYEEQKSVVYAPLLAGEPRQEVHAKEHSDGSSKKPVMEKPVVEKPVVEKTVTEKTVPENHLSDLHSLKPERSAGTRRTEKHRSAASRYYRKKKSHNSRHGRPHRRNAQGARHVRRRPKVWVIVLSVLLIFILALAVGFFVLRSMGRQSLLKHDAVDGVEITAPADAKVADEGQTVSYRGKTYQRKESVAAILCMGVDKASMEDENSRIGENGQADTIFVAALDTDTGNMTVINISRDAMADVDVYNTNNQYVKTDNMQVCLAYAYGDGRKSSCENMKKAVSRLLYGIPIDGYAAIDISAINSLNDAIGGVEVEVLEDLTDWDAELVQGETVLLQGAQAETYVRSRYTEGEKATVDANNFRMARQRQYLSNFVSKVLSQTTKNPTLPVTLYNTAAPDMVTDITVSEVTYLASLLIEQGFGSQNIVTIPGEVVMGQQYAEYHVDEEGLYQIILDAFYTAE